MNLTGEQLKDTYGNLVTIGSVAGAPTTGTLQNGQGANLTSIDVAGTITSDGQVTNGLATFTNLDDSPVRLVSGTVGDKEALTFERSGGAVKGSIEYQQSPIGFNIGTDTVHDFRIKTDGTERMKIKSDGDISFQDGSTNEAFYWDASAGSLGIGTTSPDGLLNLAHQTSTNSLSDDAGGYALTFNFEGATNDYGRHIAIRDAGGDVVSAIGGFDEGTGGATGLYFATGNTTSIAERMRIDSSGNVGIGASPSFSNGSGLEIERAGIATLRLQNTSTGKSTEITQDTNFEIDTVNTGMDIILDATTNTIFEIANSEIARINSTGLGIGTTSPADSGSQYGDLTINGTDGAFLHLQSNGSTTGVLQTIGTETRLSTAVSSGYLAFRTDDGTAGTEAMRIDSSGNVGIGTTDIEETLSITKTDGGDGTIVGVRSDSSFSQFEIVTKNSQTDWGLQTIGSRNMYFTTNGSEAMRIDSSGNVLVGKTTTGLASVGHQLNSNGATLHTKSGDTVMFLNRTTSDGTIVDLRKDNVTVGSIASRGGTTTAFITNPSSGNGAGLTGSTNMLIPSSETGVAVDNRINLGSSSARFKDLYLSGSIYLGGTTSANALDDYEEGTWSPVITDGTNDATMIAGAGGNYTKIGRQVTLTGYVRTTALGSVSGDIFIKNLPFSANSTTTFGLSTAFGFGSALNLTAGQSVGGKIEGGTSIALTVWDNTTGSTAMQASEWTNNGFIFISLTYFV